MQQIMAHQNTKLRFEPVQIPMAVAFRARPCIWEVRKTSSRRPLDKRGSRQPLRNGFFAGTEAAREVFIDPWAVREVFFSRQTEADFLRFLNQVGRFSPLGIPDHGAWELKDLRGWQQVFREFLWRSPATWD